MKPPRLLHFLHRLFAVLYNFQIGIMILGSVLLVIILAELPRRADQLLHRLEGNKPRIEYDTLRKPEPDLNPPFPYDLESGGAQLGYTDIHYLQQPPDSVRVSIRKIIKYGSEEKPRAYSETMRRTLSKTGFRFLIDSVLNANNQESIRRRQRIADSTLRADPEARIVYGREGVYSIRGGGFFTASHTVLIPFPGTLYPLPNFRNIWQWNRSMKSVNSRFDSLGLPPKASLDAARNPLIYLTFLVESWSDYQAVPWQAIVLFYGNLLLTALLFIVITNQFRLVFRALTRSVYFTDEHPRRIALVGWCFIGYAILELITYCLRWVFVQSWLKSFGVGVSFAARLNIAFPAEGLPLLIGLLLLALAQIFRYGTQLQHEQDLTV